MNNKPKSKSGRKLKVYDRMKDGKPMKFALLPKDPTPEELQQFCDFLNGEGEFAEPKPDGPPS